MKNGKKIIAGAALLTSLSVFAAGTSIVNSSRTAAGTVNTERVKPTQAEREAFRAKMDSLRQKLENGTATKAEMAEAAKFLAGKGGDKRKDGQRGGKGNYTDGITPERVEQLKTKIKSGKLTAAEAEEVLKLIERRGPGRGKNSGMSSTNNTINK